MIWLEMLGWVIILLGVGVSIALHEIGHLVPAKAFGVKVTQYMVGFGPTVWARLKGETEYGVKAIPLGGYIRMIGMYPPAKGADPTKLRAATTGRWTTLVEDARKQSMDEIGPEDADRVFYKLPVRKRIVVMLGGPTMNLVLAFVMFAIILCGIGTYQAPDGTVNVTTTIARVVPCVPTEQAPSGALGPDGACPTGSQQSPAAAGGIEPGDTIVSVNGTQTPTWDDVQAAIKASPQGDVVVKVERAGETIALTVPMQTVTFQTTDADGTTATVTRNFLGVSPGSVRETYPLSEVPAYMWGLTQRAVTTLVTLPVRLYDLAVSTFTDQPRDPNGIVGPVGVGRLGGEIVALEDTPVLDKVAGVLGLIAGLNLFLFLFNLIPLLPLDGGHVAGALWEAVKRRWARLRHEPDPGPVDVAKALPVTYVVSIFLVSMGALVLVADLIEPITLGG